MSRLREGLFLVLALAGCPSADPVETAGSMTTSGSTTVVEPTSTGSGSTELLTTSAEPVSTGATTSTGTTSTTSGGATSSGTTSSGDGGTGPSSGGEEDASSGTAGEECVHCDGNCEVRVAPEPDANPAWAMICGTATWEQAPRVAAVGGGDVFVAFQFAQAGVGDVSLTLGEVFTHEGGGDVILARLAADGVLKWSRSWGGSGSVWPVGAAAAPQDRIVIAGKFAGTFVVDGQSLGCEDCHGGFVVVLDGDGGLVWRRLLTIDEFEVYTFDIVGPAVGPDGAVIVGGFYMSDIDFGGGEVSPITNANGYLLALEPGGQDRFLRLLRTAGEPETVTAVSAGPDGSIAFAGSFHGHDLDLGNGVTAHIDLQGQKTYGAKLTAQDKALWVSGPFARAAIDDAGDVAYVGTTIAFHTPSGALGWTVEPAPDCEGGFEGFIGFVAPDRFEQVMTTKGSSTTCVTAVDLGGAPLWTQHVKVPVGASAAFAGDGATILAGEADALFELLGPWAPVGETDVWVTRVTPP